ncbi:PorP/SprF family type IX secretion system membrane protein [Paracrocinitomix mangrovi]|uniref:PorP/SprF family type IX secretion system membrane protein n=1 Tax=Paracrocinitomix mangrovi TaxID=2862509 RepID=UPI001C8E33D0|nr:PorP/SprF family type IX secretion system membrane protein [Paracrocinitomix mangrovi]UKN01469.1 PorP/SprF family type IX secretion system membrane protein [Paracrocinitomix mangrovi]
MKTMRIFFGFAALIVTANLWGQDIHFSQFYMNPLQQNPAMAGGIHAMEANINYKDQWRAVGAPYKTFALGFHMRYEKKRSQKGFLAGGVNFFTDKAGDSNMGTGQGNLNLAYYVKLNKYNRLGGGLQGGYFQRKIDYSALQWASQFDGTGYNSSLPAGIGPGQATFTKFDVGAGLSWIYNNTGGDIKVTDNHDLNFSAGVALMHINRPRYSFVGTDERLPMKVVVHGNGVISLSESSKMAICPGFMYYRQGPAQEIFVGTLFRHLLSQDSKFTGFKNGAALYWGAYLRTRDAVTAKFIIEYAGWGFGISYDINVSSLQVASNTRGGLELSLRFAAPNPFMSTYGADHSRY